MHHWCNRCHFNKMVIVRNELGLVCQFSNACGITMEHQSKLSPITSSCRKSSTAYDLECVRSWRQTTVHAACPTADGWQVGLAAYQQLCSFLHHYLESYSSTTKAYSRAARHQAYLWSKHDSSCQRELTSGEHAHPWQAQLCSVQ